MLKKIFPVIISTFIFSCASNNLVLEEPNLITNESNTQNVSKNGLFSYSISDGEVSFLKRTYNGAAYTWKDSFTSTPEKVYIKIKKVALMVNKFSEAIIKTPKGQDIYVEFLLGNDSLLYAKNTSKSEYYKIGSWSKSGKFKGESYIKTFDPTDSNWTQGFDIKIANLNKITIIESGEFYNKKETLYIDLKNDLTMLKKNKSDFDLKSFVINK